jgi:hypothetical protein
MYGLRYPRPKACIRSIRGPTRKGVLCEASSTWTALLDPLMSASATSISWCFKDRPRATSAAIRGHGNLALLALQCFCAATSPPPRAMRLLANRKLPLEEVERPRTCCPNRHGQPNCHDDHKDERWGSNLGLFLKSGTETRREHTYSIDVRQEIVEKMIGAMGEGVKDENL